MSSQVVKGLMQELKDLISKKKERAVENKKINERMVEIKTICREYAEANELEGITFAGITLTFDEKDVVKKKKKKEREEALKKFLAEIANGEMNTKDGDELFEEMKDRETDEILKEKKTSVKGIKKKE